VINNKINWNLCTQISKVKSLKKKKHSNQNALHMLKQIRLTNNSEISNYVNWKWQLFCRCIEENKLTNGLILLESPPRLLIASRMQARSTTAGTPVKSWEQYHNNINNN
jgi:hypothetical protein